MERISLSPSSSHSLSPSMMAVSSLLGGKAVHAVHFYGKPISSSRGNERERKRERERVDRPHCLSRGETDRRLTNMPQGKVKRKRMKEKCGQGLSKSSSGCWIKISNFCYYFTTLYNIVMQYLAPEYIFLLTFYSMHSQAPKCGYKALFERHLFHNYRDRKSSTGHPPLQSAVFFFVPTQLLSLYTTVIYLCTAPKCLRHAVKWNEQKGALK
jgi:hypothetical protein